MIPPSGRLDLFQQKFIEYLLRARIGVQNWGTRTWNLYTIPALQSMPAGFGAQAQPPSVGNTKASLITECDWPWPRASSLLQLLPFPGPFSPPLPLSRGLCWHLSSPLWRARAKAEPRLLDCGLLHGSPPDFHPQTRGSTRTEAEPVHQTGSFSWVDPCLPIPWELPGRPALGG